jgi:C4-dicarboxylate-specific signal transduction histidine kinase
MSVHAVPTASLTAVDLAPVLLRVAASAHAVARTRRVLLSVDVESGPLVVPGGWRDVDDALLDVVGQAVSTCQAGAVVAIDVHRESDGVAVDVTDSGPGSGAAVDPLVARELLESCGGRLTVARVEGVGTSVQLWWPTPQRERAAATRSRNARLLTAV